MRDTEARSLLERAIAATGLAARQWARLIGWTNERTVRRWRSGESPVPLVVQDRCQWLTEILTDAQRRTYVDLVSRRARDLSTGQLARSQSEPRPTDRPTDPAGERAKPRASGGRRELTRDRQSAPIPRRPRARGRDLPHPR